MRSGYSLRMRRGVFAALVATGVAAAGFLIGATEARAETLEDALVSAYTTNPTLKAERARLRATDEGVSQAISGWRPTVTATGSYGKTKTVSESPFNILFGSTERNLKPASGQVQFDQPIFRGGRTLYGTHQANSAVKAGRANLQNTEQLVLLDTVTAYTDVRRDESVLDLRKNNVAVLERRLQAAKDRFSVGENTRTDVAQAEARLSKSKSDLTASEDQLARSRAAFERIVGSAPGTLSGPPALPEMPASEEEARETALKQNPLLLSARHAEQASRYGVKVAGGSLLPSVSIQGTYRHAENQNIEDDLSKTRSIVAQVTVPLYQGGTAWSRVREAKQINSQNRMQIAEAQRQVLETVIRGWAGLRSSRARIVSDKDQVRANEIALDGVQQEKEVGARTTLDVLDAEQELLDARVALARTERDEYVAGYTLLAAIGHLTASDLGLAVTLYNPKKNYKSSRFRFLGFSTYDE